MGYSPPPERLSIGDVLLRTPRVSAEQWRMMPAPVRWLVMVRAVVLVMTVNSVAVGVLPAIAAGHFHPLRLIALLAGLVCAHATNNLINDYVDARQGLDTEDYFRRRYGVHVLQDGLVSIPDFALVTALTGMVALACGIWLAWMKGPMVLYLMLAGAIFLVFYTWPLKHYALGELAVLLVWGPLMTAGSYYVMAGTIAPGILVLAFVYGIGPTLVVLGKHIDKIDQDRRKHVRSLPVVLGDGAARYLALVLIVLQWGLMGWACISGALPLWMATTLVSLPAAARLVQRIVQGRPAERPAHYAESIWPLWYSAFAFRYSRDFGVLLVAALAIQSMVPA